MGYGSLLQQSRRHRRRLWRDERKAAGAASGRTVPVGPASPSPAVFFLSLSLQDVFLIRHAPTGQSIETQLQGQQPRDALRGRLGRHARGAAAPNRGARPQTPSPLACCCRGPLLQSAGHRKRRCRRSVPIPPRGRREGGKFLLGASPPCGRARLGARPLLPWRSHDV